MPKGLSLAELYPLPLRTALVDWATRAGSPGLPPPAVVADHLRERFDDATRRGRRRGGLTALVVVWLPTVALIVAALVLRPR